MAKRNNGQSPDDVEAAIEDILGWLPHYQNKITCPQITSRFDPKIDPTEFHKLYESDPTQMHELALKDAEANAWLRGKMCVEALSGTINTGSKYRLLMELMFTAPVQPKRGRGGDSTARRDRDLLIAVAIHRTISPNIKATRSPGATTESAASIVQKALERLDFHMEENLINDIWKKCQRDARRVDSQVSISPAKLYELTKKLHA